MVAPDEALFGKKYQGVEKRSTGYKLLAAMGWKEGEGLGATKQGIKEHVRVRKKADTIGVGLKEAAEHSKDWKIGMVAFDHVLSALKEVRAQHDKDQHGQSTADSDSSSSEEEEEEEAPAAPPPKKKARVQPAAQPKSEPVRRKSKMKAVAAAESTADEVSMGKKPSKKQKLRKDTQQAAAAAAAAAAAKNPTHLGRFARREAGKRVKGYSATDLAAILGGGASDAPPKAAPAAEPATLDAPEQPAPSSDASEETALEVGDDAGTSQPEQDDSGKWWSKAFSRAGRMGSRPMDVKDAPKPKVNVHGFSEQDQVDLYSLTQGGASKSKQGLGQASAPKKVAGARWEGTKMRIGDASDLDEPEQAEAATPAADAEVDAAEPEMGTNQQMHMIFQPKSKQQEAKHSAEAMAPRKKAKLKAAHAAAGGTQGASDGTATAVDRVKWKKICRQVLSAEPGQKLSRKKLLKKITSSTKLIDPLFSDQLLSRLQRSSQFTVTEKHVMLT
ncbi:hypothetical protein WJX74_009295 [Apatococcus lobatus]|uniref:G-patch domain-containing protein n=1 Tax=Apatococcus lobatus TaxID=904363 RepID=A0AAW1RE38_9CHLO